MPSSALLRPLALACAASTLGGCAELILDPDQVKPAPPREAVALRLLQQPVLQVVAGQNLGSPALQVELLDAEGFRLTWDDETPLSLAPVASSDGQSPLQPLFGTLSATVVAGVATFDGVSARRAGRLRIAAYAGDNLSGAALVVISDDIEVTPAGKSRLGFDTQPTGGMAGPTAVGVVRVEIEDTFGNRTHDTDSITVLSWHDTLDEPAAAPLTGTTTVDAIDGLAELDDLGLSESGPFRIKATASGLEDVVSEPFTIVPAGPARLEFTGSPKAQVRVFESLGSFGVRVTDAYGQVTAADTFTIRMVAIRADGSGYATAQPVGTTAVTTQDGVATFSGLTCPVSSNATGLFRETIRLMAFDGSSPTESVLVPAFSSDVVVVPDVPAALMVAAQPTAPPSVASNFAALHPVVVAILDAHNNLAEFNDTVTVTAYDAAGTSPASLILGGTPTVTAVDGVAVLDDLTYRRAECITLRATAGSLTPAVSDELCLPVDMASAIPTFSATPSGGVACQDLADVSITVQDQYGNPAWTAIQVAAYDDTVDVPASAALTGTTTAVTIAGAAIYHGLRYPFAECIRLRADSAEAAPGFSEAFCVVPGPSARLVTATNPGSRPFAIGDNIVAATGNDFLVRVTDACGNTATSDSSTVVTLAPVDPSTRDAVGAFFCVAGSCNDGDAHATASGGVARFTDLSFLSDDTVRIAAYVGSLAASPLTVGYSPTLRFAPAVGTLEYLAQPQSGASRENFCADGNEVVVQVLDGIGNPIVGIPVGLLAWKSATDAPATGAFARSLAAMQAGGEVVQAVTDASGRATFTSLYYSLAETVRLKAVVSYAFDSWDQVSAGFVLN